MKTVEELLCTLVDKNFKLDSSDVSLMYSLYRQIHKGIGFTDRQHELVKEKLILYKDQFDEFLYEELDNLKLPLRKIDRSKTIKVVERNNNLFIAVRFPFSKKMISHIEALNSLQNKKDYDKESKTHYVEFNEGNIFSVLEIFDNKKFEIDQRLLTINEKIKTMTNDKENNVPGIYGLKLKNLHRKAFDLAISSFGEPNKDNLALYNDRKDILGLEHFDDYELQDSLNKLQPLTKKIIQRSKPAVFINSKTWTLNNVLESLLELMRLPLLVVINQKESHDTLITLTQSLENIIFNEDVFVAFRKDNDGGDGTLFNQYIQEKQFSNKLDNTTKIVYISNNKLPKPVLNSSWKPQAVLNIGSTRGHSHVETYINECDLVIHYDETVSMINRKIIDIL